jgi:hypothetical protein
VGIMRLDGHQFFVESDIKFINVGLAEHAMHGHHGCNDRIGSSGVKAQNGVADSIPIDGANGLKREHTKFGAGVSNPC